MASGPFSEYEQRFLLAEVLKSSNVSIDSLVDFLRDEVPDPNWRFVGLPAGRNVDDCQNTFESLIQTGELPLHNPNAPHTPGTSQSIRRAPGSYFASSTRPLKPKPQHSANGTPQQPYSGKKRGRPSKADLERRAQEAAAAAADEGGMPLSIGADGAVIAGQKRKIGEGEAEDETLDLVQQAQGALAMPAAMMQVEGQPPVKRGRGRPRKIRPEDQQQQQQQLVEQQPLENQQQHEQQDTSQLSPDQEVTADEMVLAGQLQHDAAQHPQPQERQEQPEQQLNADSPGGSAMRFFRELQQQNQAMGASTGHNHQ